MLEIKNVTKIYDGNVLALDDVSFNIKQGEFLAIIGLSGSGKSTLLRCINRLVEPTEGDIILDDVNITKASQDELRRIRRKIGMIFQHFNLVERSKVMTNVLAGRLGYTNPAMSLLNRFSKNDVEMALKQLERVGIKDQAYKRADELSGGQQQRVSIARAMMQNPKLILADEPVASLDPVTVICSLHFLDLVHRYANRAIALNAGKLMFDGSPKDIDDEKFKEIYGKEAERVG
jgi:phosphonate transport system ATP-binding protein